MSNDISIVNFFLHRPPDSQPFACIPMGTMYLCGSIEKAGYSLDFHDYQLYPTTNPYSPGEIARFLLKTESRLVGISIMSNMLPYLLLGLRIFKRERKDAFVVLGGAGVGGFSAESFAHFPEVDAILNGEGEQAVVEIIEAFKGKTKWESIRGLTYRKDGVRSNPGRTGMQDLDLVPYPAYHRLDLASYRGFPVLTARGCPYKCTFCDISRRNGYAVGRRKIVNVIDEIEMLRRDFGAASISILDDSFSLGKNRVKEFCFGVLARKMRFEWGCMCRVDHLSDELMDLMHEAGCRKMFLGIESGSPKVRDTAGKGLGIKNVEDLISRAASRFQVTASFIMGFPFESLDDFRETIFLMIYCKEKGAQPQICVLSPLPNAELTQMPKYEKIFDPDTLSGMAYGEYTKKAGEVCSKALTGEVQGLIGSWPGLFSAFYHFKEGMVREKIKIAATYGLIED
ncbi:MAG: B12-binding domain-containing radical SAM protein [Deltaproteobacteria bacterium]|nr:B12-binding domain-containing radical SAM protein [Deltaproteobacteria bacterium]